MTQRQRRRNRPSPPSRPFKPKLYSWPADMTAGAILSEFAGECAQHTKAVVLIGKTAGKNKRTHFEEKGDKRNPFNIFTKKTFVEAFRQANSLAKAGRRRPPFPRLCQLRHVLNYEGRGKKFKDMVLAL